MALLCASLFLLSAFTVFIQKTVAVFGPSNPGRQENFDPAQADPKGKITCTGPPPSFSIPISYGLRSDPAGWTLQQICAKPQYGGKGLGEHAGGYCFHYSTPSEGPRVMFDHSALALASPVLQSPRVLSYCLLRCSCTNGITRDDAYDQIKPAQMSSWMTRQTSLDEDLIGGLDTGGGNELVPTIMIRAYSQLKAQQFQAWHNGAPVDPTTLDVVGMSLDPENEVTCNGDIPLALTLTLYDPRGPSFGTVQWPVQEMQKLCANTLSGGTYNLNAGAYCHRMGGNKKKVWFSDDITPNLAMTWQNFAQSLTIRAYCFSMCHCDGEEKNKDEELRDRVKVPGVFQYLQNRAVGIGPKGNVDIYVTGPDANGKTAEIPLMHPSADGAQVATGACDDDKQRFCPLDSWDEGLLGGPKPVAPVPEAPLDELVPLDQCGMTCDNHNDCGGSWDSGCRCVAPKTMPQYVPLDPVFPKMPTLPQGRCLTVPKYVLKVAAAGQTVLGKRGELSTDGN